MSESSVGAIVTDGVVGTFEAAGLIVDVGEIGADSCMTASKETRSFLCAGGAGGLLTSESADFLGVVELSRFDG